MKQKGFATLIGILLITLSIAGGVYIYLDSQKNKDGFVNQINFVDEIEEKVDNYSENNKSLTEDIESNLEEEKNTYLTDTSRADEIEYYSDKPVGYSNPQYSNIVGYDKRAGIILSIPTGVVPSIIDDGSLGEVTAYRLEDSLTGEYNDVFVIFSCFEAGLPKLNKISYIDYSEDVKSSYLNIGGYNYHIKNYENFFIASNLEYVGPSETGMDIFGCGVVMVGKEFSEVHVGFLERLTYIESREDYLKTIYKNFNELYYKPVN